MIWSDERTETLIKLWDGGQSAGEIRKVFDCSRNAVIGKISRLRAQGRITRVEAPRKPGDGSGHVQRRRERRTQLSTRPRLVTPPRPPRALPKPSAPAIDYANAKPWVERKFGECAFPIGEGGDLLSCSAPTERTYCPACEGVMFRPEQPTRKSTMRMARLAA